MIDLIAFTIPCTGTPELENLELSWEGQYRGNYKNLKVIQFPDRVYCRGSIAKFLQGENVSTLSRKGVIKALEKLEYETGWNLKKAELKQLEIGCTIPVDHSVNDYLKNWGRVPRNKLRTYQGKTIESVTNTTGNRSFIGYDKKHETRGKVPSIFSGMELLRLELKYKKQLKNYLGVCSPWDIVEKDFYRLLISKFQDFYFSIPKNRIPVLNLTEGLTPKDIDNLMKFGGLQFFNDLSSTIEHLGEIGKLSRVDRVRKAIRDIQTNLKYTEPDELTKELDSKVRAQTMFC